MIYVGSKVKIIYNGVESDELIVDSIDIDKLIILDDNNETV